MIILRQQHLAEKTALHATEVHYRLELSKQYENEKLSCVNIWQQAILIQYQTQRIIDLSQDKVARFEALEKWQAKELWRLFQTKSEPILFNEIREKMLCLEEQWETSL